MARRYVAGDVVRCTSPGSDLDGREGLVLRVHREWPSGVRLSLDVLRVAYGAVTVVTDEESVELVRAADEQLTLPVGGGGEGVG